MLKKKHLSLFLLIALPLLYWRYCTSHQTFLGETTFFKNDKLELKIVTRHEYLPLHYIGDSYSVGCRSDSTTDFNHSKLGLGKGWNAVPSPIFTRGPGEEIKYDHRALAAEAEKFYEVSDHGVIAIVRENALSFSFDACRSFATWDFDQLPENFEMINTSEFNECKSRMASETRQGLRPIKCTILNFTGTNRLNFSKVATSATGRANFEVRSRAFKKIGYFSVGTTDYGKSWTLEEHFE